MPAVLANCTWTSDTGVIVNPGHHACRVGMHYNHIDEPPAQWAGWEALVRNFAAHMVEVGRRGHNLLVGGP